MASFPGHLFVCRLIGQLRAHAKIRSDLELPVKILASHGSAVATLSSFERPLVEIHESQLAFGDDESLFCRLLQVLVLRMSE